MEDYKQRFLQLAIRCEALKFGEFTLKSGRVSPYFFNAGTFNTGAALAELASCYRAALDAAGIDFDMLFGPAYKGIALATALACNYANQAPTRDIPWAHDRKEAKHHGEGGQLVGAPIQGRVVIVDDVITAGTAARQAWDMISAYKADPVALMIGLDRQEKLENGMSARASLENGGVKVISVADCEDLLHYMKGFSHFQKYSKQLNEYKDEWCV